MEVYVEKAFLDELWSAYLRNENTEVHDQIRRFLLKANFARIIIDVPVPSSKEDLIKLLEDNPILDEILNSKAYESKPTFKKEASQAKFFRNGLAAKFFFVYSDTEAQQIEIRFGCVAITNKSLHKARFLFNVYTIPISQLDQNITNWDFIENYKHPCNALLLIDNYLLQDWGKTQEQNLIRLMTALLPKSLDENFSFELTIISQEISNDDLTSNDIRRKANELLNQLKQKGINYLIDLTIIQCEDIDRRSVEQHQIKKIHDRHIFTNYIWINSGFGFSLFRQNKITKQYIARTDTHISIMPSLCLESSVTTYYGKKLPVYQIHDIRKMLLQRCLKICNESKFFIGTKSNRILS